MNRFSDAIFLRDVLQKLLECAWATMGQWKVFPEDNPAPTDPPPAAETCTQTIRPLAGQSIIYTDGMGHQQPPLALTLRLTGRDFFGSAR